MSVVLACRTLYLLGVSDRVAYNVLPLAAVGDFEAFHCQPSTNFDISTALDLTKSAPLWQTAVMRSAFFSMFVVVTISSLKSRLLIKFQVLSLSQLILRLSLAYYSFRHHRQPDSLVAQLLKSLCPLLRCCQ